MTSADTPNIRTHARTRVSQISVGWRYDRDHHNNGCLYFGRDCIHVRTNDVVDEIISLLPRLPPCSTLLRLQGLATDTDRPISNIHARL